MHRSFLYVPGDRPDRIAKALATEADAVIADLEDAVAHANKAAARATVAEAVTRAATRPDGDGGPELLVRVNNDDALADDLAAVVAAGCRAIYLPKADLDSLTMLTVLLAALPDEAALPDQAALLDQAASPAGGSFQVVALIETARGLLDVEPVAAHPLVRNLAIGEADLVAELAMDPSPDRRELTALRTSLVVASAAAGIDSPTGPVNTDFRDLDALRSDTEALARMGFGARSAIHPAQVPVINEVFTPSPEEVAEARELVEQHDAHLASGTGAFVDGAGRMVDEAVVRSARRVLARVR